MILQRGVEEHLLVPSLDDEELGLHDLRCSSAHLEVHLEDALHRLFAVADHDVPVAALVDPEQPERPLFVHERFQGRADDVVVVGRAEDLDLMLLGQRAQQLP